MNFKIFLDFDGVLFDSIPEVYDVCQKVTSDFPTEYQRVDYKEFKEFRSHLTDAWQFNRLYHKFLKIVDFTALPEIIPEEEDWLFTDRFFDARTNLMENDHWASIMKPYQFFHNIEQLLRLHPDKFLIISTRNEISIERTLAHHNIKDVKVFGQNAVRASGSKLNALQDAQEISDTKYLVYVDDMRSHLQPFREIVNVCLQAEWGYDIDTSNAASADEVTTFLKSMFSTA